MEVSGQVQDRSAPEKDIPVPLGGNQANLDAWEKRKISHPCWELKYTFSFVQQVA
jgi:hypothetical protein